MSVVVEGGAVSAAAVGFARMRPRRGRVRREPIDVEQIAAEFAEPKKRPEHEIIAALEAEVRRATQARAAAALPAPAIPAETPSPAPARPAVAAESEGNLPAPHRAVITPEQLADPNGPAFPLDQVRAWLEQVKDDLRKVQARVEFLQFEQDRLQGQQNLVTELFSATTSA
jgi:hypothetical protein